MYKTYELDKNGKLKLLDASEKSNLADGVILHWGGNRAWPEEDFVIIGREKTKYGVIYKTASLKNGRTHQVEAINVKFASEGVWHSQHFFVTHKKLEGDELTTLRQYAESYIKEKKEKRDKEELERKQKIEKGKELAALKIPAEAQALIVAEKEVDESDPQTDYFHVKTVKMVVLGHSLHTRDIFSEMRKHAGKLAETKHLTENNKDYEHREKYSGGSGYYLKAEVGYSDGWKVCKLRKWNGNWSDNVYVSLAENCVL